ncbi:MAG: LD-carboxypeptidase [Bacilli bacterium]
MIYKLKKGDTIGVVGVSNSLYLEHDATLFYKAEKKFIDNGYKIKRSSNVFDNYHGMASTPEVKAQELMKMFLDEEVKAIICLVGGASCNTILDYLDFDIIKKHPKILMGYSDITVLLESIYKMTGIITFHGPDFLDFGKDYADVCMTEFINVFEKGIFHKFLNSEIEILKDGNCNGKIIGTNLQCSLYIIGTKYFPEMDKNIFALERYITNPSETYNEFYRLKHMGVFDKISGMLIGYNYSYQIDHKYDILFENIAMDVCKDYNFPIFKCNTFGHMIPNAIIPIGAGIEISHGKIKLKENIFES